MTVASLVTNASCYCIPVLKCEMMKPNGIINEVFVLRSYSKWKDRSIDTQKLSTIICSRVQLSWEQLACVTGQIKLLARPCTYNVTLLYRSAWKVK